MLRSDDHGRVRLLTFDRPDARNAFDAALYRATGAALRDALADDDVSAVVLTGAGTAFSAGQALEEMAALATAMAAGEARSDRGDTSGFSDLLDAVQVFDKPLLAAVNGAAVGVGFTLLAHCDLVLLATSARCKAPFAPLGVAPEAGASLLFPALMGWQRAAEVLLLGDWLDADAAVAAGVGLRVVPDGDVVAETLALASRVAASPLPALRAIKRTMLAARADAITAARRCEEDEFRALLAAMGARPG